VQEYGCLEGCFEHYFAADASASAAAVQHHMSLAWCGVTHLAHTCQAGHVLLRLQQHGHCSCFVVLVLSAVWVCRTDRLGLWVCHAVVFADSTSGISTSVTIVAMACPWISFLGFCRLLPCLLLPMYVHSCMLLLSWRYTFVWPFWPLQVVLVISIAFPGNVSVL
jgi:hypothetical protein